MTDLPSLKFIYGRVEPCRVELDMHQAFVRYRFGIDEAEKQRNVERLLGELTFQQSMISNALSMSGDRDKLQAIKSMARATSLWRMYTGMEKLEGTAQAVLNGIKNKDFEKCVVFCSQVDFVTQLQQKLKEIHPIVLFTGTPHEKRRNHLLRFKRNAHNKVLISMVQAMQFPTDITAASYIFMAEPSWVHQENAQAIMRCHNMNQQRAVSVKWMLSHGSVEAKVTQLLQRATAKIVKGPEEFELVAST